MEFYLDEKQKQKKQRKRKIKIFVSAAVFLFLISAVFYLIVFSPFFKVKSVIVKFNGVSLPGENEKLISDLKIFLARNSKLANFLGDMNIIFWSDFVNNNGIEKFLKNNPAYSDLKIENNILKKQVVIEISKRERFGVWCYATSTCFWFDKFGVLFENAPNVEGELIYKINQIESSDPNYQLAFGDKVLPDGLFQNLLKIFNVLQKSDLKIKTIYLDNLDFQEVEVRPAINLPKIYFSLRFDPEWTLAAIDDLKKNNNDLGKIQYIDFRVENRVYYR